MTSQTNIGDNNTQVINMTNIYETASEIGELLRNGNHAEAKKKLDKLETDNTNNLNTYLTYRFWLLVVVAITMTTTLILFEVLKSLIGSGILAIMYVLAIFGFSLIAKWIIKHISHFRLKQSVITEIKKEIIKYALYQKLKKNVKMS